MPGDGHAGFGRRSGETHQRQRWQGAPGRPYNTSHRKVRARVEHAFARMKTWKLLTTAGS